jgi:phosphoribosylanthranilate isomerase
MTAALLVKVCGVTSAGDARAAVAAGADAIGVNLWPGSKRFVGGVAAARAVLAVLPPTVLKVGVFVNAPAAEVARQVEALGLDRAQLHGDEAAPDFAALAGLAPPRIIRAVRVRDASSFAGAAGWSPGSWLYDAFSPGYGGSGMMAPWALVARHARRPFLLAGGLTPENVAAAIAATRPDGVDVASGVEEAPGRKDPAKLAAFVAAARRAAIATL